MAGHITTVTKLAVFLALSASQSQGAKLELQKAVPSIVNNNPSKNLLEYKDTTLQSTVVFSKGIETAKDIVIFFGGTGAKTSDFGIAATISPMVKRLLANKVAIVGFENPLYWSEPSSETWSTTNAQLQFISNSIKGVVETFGTEPIFRVFSRSTATSLVLQLLHENYLDSTKYEIVSRIKSFLMMGLLNYEASEFQQWHQREIDFLSSIDGLDDRVSQVERQIHSGFSWLEPVTKPHPGDVKIPNIYVIIGSVDPLYEPEKQEATLARFSVGHPRITVTGVGMDTFHNPGSSVTYESKEGKIINLRQMERFGAFLDWYLNNETFHSGYKKFAIPTFWDVKGFGAQCDELDFRSLQWNTLNI